VRISPLYIGSIILVLGVLLPRASAAQETLALKEMVSVIQDTCVKCHGGRSTKAGVDLSTFQTEIDVWRDRGQWSKMQQLIADGDMPPEKETPLTEAQRGAVSGWIQHTLDNVDADRIPRNPGFVPPRRLTGKEYNFTVQDIFGLTGGPVYDFPEDLVIGDSFDNDASTLSVEALWFEKALDAADATVRAVWGDADVLNRLMVARPSIPRAEDSALYVTPKEVSAKLGTGGDFSVLARITGKPTRIFNRSFRGRDTVRGSKVFSFEGDTLVYRISSRESLRATGLDFPVDEPHWVGLTVREGNATMYLDGRLLASRPDLTRPDFEEHLFKVGAKPRERRRRRDSEPPPVGKLESFQFYAGGLPDTVMTKVHAKTADDTLPVATFRWVAGMETPPQENFITVEAAVDTVIRSFLSDTFRRTPTAEEMERYTGLLQAGLDSGLTFDIAMQHPVATALISPAFLFRSEAAVETDDIYAVADIDLANRLSYFLWSSVPDAELRDLAERGALSDPEELLRQTDRMLKDERAQRFYERFVLQWLRTEGLGDTIQPDADRFPEVTDVRMAAMRQEGVEFFKNAVQEDRSLLNLLDADYTFMNEELAAHYNYSEVSGPEWREVTLADASRGGLLTQAATLTVSSAPRRTSPVFRGKWVLEVILGDPPPPPPANVPSLPSEVKPGGSSLRELLEAHRNQPACAGCHSRIDPYGLALEQYDPVGALRTKPQDTKTELSTGEALDGVVDLKAYLLRAKKTEFIRHLTKKMLAYSLGRELKFPDERSVYGIVAQLEDTDLGAKQLIHEVVLSEPFRYRMNPSYETQLSKVEVP
jgi:hypothetical protein